MYNLYSILKDIDDLPNGETKRIDCPECGGYKTFTVTNNMGRMLWNCYKASCSISGSKPVHMSANDIRQAIERKEKAQEHFVMPEYVVPYRGQPDVTRFMERFNLMGGLYHDVKDNRAVFPIMQDGVIVDAVGRSLRNSLPKWKKYGNSGLPFTSGCGKVAVVVEDCVSAAIVGNDVLCGVAVLGTSLSSSHRQYLSQFSTAVIALDPDALPKTLSMAKELRGYVDDVRVLRLTDDLKYRREEDIEQLTHIGDTVWN